jgi:hypothetical protein
MNIRILPEERLALRTTALENKLTGVGALIRGMLFSSTALFQVERNALAINLERELAKRGSGSRVIVSVRINPEERRLLRSSKRRSETSSDLVRRNLGLLPISVYFRKAALTSSRRRPGPTILTQDIWSYRLLVETQARIRAAMKLQMCARV